MRLPILRRLFDDILRLALAPPLVLAIGCSPTPEERLPVENHPGESTRWLPDPAAYELPLCTPDQSPDVNGVSPGIPVDYLELRLGFQHWFLPENWYKVLSSSGIRCATATGRVTCESELTALSNASGFLALTGTFGNPYTGSHYLATTRGDAVGSVRSREDLVRFLASIDTPLEAMLVAWLSGYQFYCADKNKLSARRIADGYEVRAIRGHGCGPGEDIVRQSLHVTSAGDVTVLGTEVLMKTNENCAAGRRPPGLLESQRPRTRSALGRYFAAAAHLEAASIAAFRTLREELSAHRAPERLLHLAERAALDEIRHARMTARLALRYGGRPVRPSVELQLTRSLEEIAIENAQEGCVRETHGALVGRWQAACAGDAAIRSVMARIAEDETRHAELAWQIARWAERRLGAAARRRVRDAQRDAVRQLRSELAAEPAPELVVDAGLPTSAQALRLLDLTERELWTSAA